MTCEGAGPEAHRVGRDWGRKGELEMEGGGGGWARWLEGAGLLH